MPPRHSEGTLVVLDSSAAKSLRSCGLGTVALSKRPAEQQIYDLPQPVLYVHLPALVVRALPESEDPDDRDADDELRGLFDKAAKKWKVQPVPASKTVPAVVRRAIASGCILGVVFAEKVPVDNRLASLPWEDLRKLRCLGPLCAGSEAGGLAAMIVDDEDRARVKALRRWRSSWRIRRADVTRGPVMEYTEEMLSDLLFGEPLGVSVEGFKFRRESPPARIDHAKSRWAEDLLPQAGMAAPVVIEVEDDEARRGRIAALCKEDRGANCLWSTLVTERISRTYGVDSRMVEATPLFVNKMGEWLGCAVRIGKGAVLVLPEFPDKAAVMKKMATELWGDVQAWLGGGAKSSGEAARAEPRKPQPARREQKLGPPAGEQDDPDWADWTETEKDVYRLHQEAFNRGYDPPTFGKIAAAAKENGDSTLDHREKVKRIVQKLEKRLGEALPGREGDKARRELSVPNEDLDKRSTDRRPDS